jgi:hypothetical protein
MESAGWLGFAQHNPVVASLRPWDGVRPNVSWTLTRALVRTRPAGMPDVSRGSSAATTPDRDSPKTIGTALFGF